MIWTDGALVTQLCTVKNFPSQDSLFQPDMSLKGYGSEPSKSEPRSLWLKLSNVFSIACVGLQLPYAITIGNAHMLH